MSLVAFGQALAAKTIAAAYLKACLDELDALKVGNVHAYAAGHRMAVADFVESAKVSAPHLARVGARVGERVEAGGAATWAAVGQNTNLGILLLCAPLARAAEAVGPLRAALGAVLADLDAGDGAAVFAAIRRANPGGLGASARYDVTAEHDAVPLGAAMAEAAARDRIAHAYGDGFDDIFTLGLPALVQARDRGLTRPWQASAVHIAFLTQVVDSHILRKHGRARAEAVRAEAQAELGALDLAQAPVDALLAYDGRLKAAGINPGTCADFTVATLFLDALLRARGETA